MMIPIVSRKNRKFFRVLILTFILSLFVECIQLIFRVGSFDVDDLIFKYDGRDPRIPGLLSDELCEEEMV